MSNEKAETQESISQWAEETFGPVGSNARVAARANEEMAELIRALTVDDNNPKAAEEAADVKIVLYRLAARMGLDLDRQQSKPAFPSWASNLLVAANAGRTLGSAIFHLAYLNNRDAEHYVMRAVNDLAFLVKRLGSDLAEEINKKMAINRSRQWKLDNTGHGYHV